MKIVNFGSLNIDFTFHVDQIVRPGQTVDAIRVERFPGGKGLNQSLALARAGAKVYHAGVIGKDGLFLKALLEKDGVDCRYLQIRDDADTGKAFIQVDKNGQNCIVLDGGANRMNTEEDCARALSGFEKGDWALVQNEIACVDRIIDMAHARALRVIFNPSPMNDGVMRCDLKKVSLFLMNRDEGARITGCDKPDEIVRAMAALYPRAEVILTLGSDGCLWSGMGRVIRQAACRVKAVDTTGAGDTFTGYALACLSRGDSVERSLQTASRAAAIAVTRNGAASAIPYASEVAALTEHGASSPLF